MTGVRDGINTGFEKYVADGLGIDLDIYVYGITLGIDSLLSFVIMAR